MILGEQQQEISSPLVNSGLFTALLEAGDVKATFVGHDHVNDYCGNFFGIHLCFGGGTGYHAYGWVLLLNFISILSIAIPISDLLVMCST